MGRNRSRSEDSAFRKTGLEIYYNKGNGDEKCAISFRNYVLNEMGMKNSSRYRRDKEYWKNRLDIIPEAPVLPMRSNAEKSNKFIRMARKLSAEDWEKIKFFSSQNSVTPTATVLWEFVNSTKEKRFEAYAKAIEKKTCINVSAELLEATFEIYQHGFKGANVELPFYSGDICYLSACEEQKYFFADKNQNLEMWNDICLGEFEVINVPGNHVTCIHSEENATLLAQIIIERNIRG